MGGDKVYVRINMDGITSKEYHKIAKYYKLYYIYSNNDVNVEFVVCVELESEDDALLFRIRHSDWCY